MRNGFRIAAISAAMVAGLALSGAAHAQVSFSGTFPLPHGTISIGIGDPYFRVGAYVPPAYQVCARDGYGYGFMYGANWIPVRRYGAGWRVYGSPWHDDVYHNDVYYGGSYYTGRFSPRYHAHPYHSGGYAHNHHDNGGHRGDHHDRGDNQGHGHDRGDHYDNHGNHGRH